MDDFQKQQYILWLFKRYITPREEDLKMKVLNMYWTVFSICTGVRRLSQKQTGERNYTD